LFFLQGLHNQETHCENGIAERGQRKIEVLTSREASPLVAASELYVEVGYQCMDVVIPFHLQAER